MSIAAFFKYMSLLVQFWGVIKEVLVAIEGTPEEQRRELTVRILKASKMADESGDTSEYEDIIRRGRR